MPSTFGLKGGIGAINIPEQPNNQDDSQLRLLNYGTDCFVNSVIQLLRVTPYVDFLKQFQPFLIGLPAESYKLCRALSDLYSNQTRDPVSTASVRKYVAEQSGKLYLDSGTQEDAEEFLVSLEVSLSQELVALEEFKVVRDKHWGTQLIETFFG